MNCLEFERILPDVIEGGHTPEQQAHLNSCPACSSLLADLTDISAQAKYLAESDEPSPVVWNAIEAQLRSEGLIARSASERPAVPWLRRWQTAWLVPVAAALAIVVGIKLYHPAGAGEHQQAVKHIVVAPGENVRAVSSEDQQFLKTVSTRRSARQARADMDDANAFIRDAEQVVKSNPGDVYAQQMLMNAYEQKQMLYDLAVDRSSGQ
ncbi:MAG TPA: hypothetical protein VF133_08830 [Terriglobales bacterium]